MKKQGRTKGSAEKGERRLGEARRQKEAYLDAAGSHVELSSELLA